jgi:predicted AlkP superfamily phosphohydrolase/phosphomutase
LRTQKALVVLAAAAVAGVVAILAGHPADPEAKPARKVVVLGFDGADPDIIRAMWAKGELPNLKSLAETGSMVDLATTVPPESPVAWASFAIGANPGKHGIYDFLKRDTATYFPGIATADVVRPKFLWGFLPIRAPKVINLLRGTPFWRIASEGGARTIAYQIPVTFPPEELANGYMFSGLGVPDIRGTQATFQYYATDLAGGEAVDTEMGGKLIAVVEEAGRIESRVVGPWNPVVGQKKRDIQSKLQDLRAKIRAAKGVDERNRLYEKRKALEATLAELKAADDLTLPVVFTVDRAARALDVALDGQTRRVAEGEWSDWFEVRFRVTPLVSVRGICKFYPIEVAERVRIYLSPIDFHPVHPPFAFTAPKSLGRELYDVCGHYKSRGWPEETAGLKEEKIGEDPFLEDLMQIMDNREKMTFHLLEKKPWDLFVSVFSETDRVQHMMYRLIDPAHPRYDSTLAAVHGGAVEQVYRRMDDIVGKTLDRIPDDATFLVVSDHGFNSFRRGVNINTWLVRNGFMALEGMENAQMKLDDLFGGGDFFQNVDWSRTRAYSIGLGLIFLNVRGREAQGIVDPSHAGALKREIIEKLGAFTDPETGARVVRHAYDGAEVFAGPYIADAPDIVIGFDEGYRVSWQTALGGVPRETVVANLDKWSGDHCSVDEEITRGVLFSRRPVTKPSPHIVDVAPTILRDLGLEPGAEMEGRALY